MTRIRKKLSEGKSISYQTQELNLCRDSKIYVVDENYADFSEIIIPLMNVLYQLIIFGVIDR